MPSRATVLVLLLAPLAAVRAQAPAPPAEVPPESTAVPEPPSAAAPGPPAPEPPPSRKGFSAFAGWGYYEALHLGVSYHVTERAAFSLFGGYGVAESATTVTIGLSFAHDLFGRLWTIQPGWTLKGLYWTRDDSKYDWTNFSFLLGGYLEKDLGRRIRIALEGGVALTGMLQTDRKQNVDFGHPQRWNGNVCLEIAYHLGGP